MEVVSVEQFRKKEAPAAEYITGTPDGSRPGKVYVNTGDYQHRSTLNIESTAYHEGIPAKTSPMSRPRVTGISLRRVRRLPTNWDS